MGQDERSAANFSKPGPFLKWAGGKRWLVSRYAHLLPSFSGRYLEPFLGGGSVFFHLSPVAAILSDSNPRLIECYEEIRDSHQSISRILSEHQRSHSTEYYYQIRSTHFETRTERAAQFLYLNRTCWNGLYRVNLNGQFNVPIGTKSKVIIDGEDFARLSSVMRDVSFETCDFEKTINRAKKGDFVFVDPPYTVNHNLNGFLKYNEKIFSWQDQERLKRAVMRAAKRGAKLLVSNAAHRSILDLYSDIGEIKYLKRGSVLAGRNEARGVVEEILVSI